MHDFETAMLIYAHLARVSAERRQRLAEDRFLLQAGAAACSAGWPEPAELCRRRVAGHNPAHLVARFETFAAAVRDPDFASLLKQLDRQCGFEQAEHLVAQLGIDIASERAAVDGDLGAFVLRLLADPHETEPARETT
jgi:hypothetical protein